MATPNSSPIAQALMALAGRDGRLDDAKSPLFSRSLWVLLIALVGGVVQRYTGWLLSPEDEVVLLAVVAIVLRMLTGRPVAWGANDKPLPKQGMPGRRARRGTFKRLWKTVTVSGQVLACGLILTSCAGVQVCNDNMALVLRDGSTPTTTRLVVECSGTEVASSEIETGDMLGLELCQNPSVRAVPGPTEGTTAVGVYCGDVPLFVVDLKTSEVFGFNRPDDAEAN